MRTSADKLTPFTSELFGVDVSGGGLPEAVHANRVVLSGAAAATYNEARREVTISLEGEVSVALVSETERGAAAAFPTGQRRVWHSDGSTDGGVWSTIGKTTFDAAYSNNTIALSKLYYTGATAGQHPEFDGTSTVAWVGPSLLADGSRELTADWDTGGTYHIQVIDAVADEDVPNWGQVQAAIGDAGGGTITAVVAGAGLTGGAVTGSATLDVVANADGSIVVNANDIQVGTLATDAQHGNLGKGSLHEVATTTVNGFMSASDKEKLDGLPDDVTVTQITHPPCLFAITQNVNTASPGTDIADWEGETLGSGDRLFLAAQTTPAQNGPWVWNGASSALTRPSDWTGTETWGDIVHVFPIARTRSAGSILDGLTGGPTLGCQYVTGVSYQSTITVGTTNVPFIHIGDDRTVVGHRFCSVRTTCRIDVDACPAVIDGETLVIGGANPSRVFVDPHYQEFGHQGGIWQASVDNGDGTVTLSRPSDWAAGARLYQGQVHMIPISSGNLWQPHMVCLNIGSSFSIWSSTGDDTTWAVLLTTHGPVHDVIDTEIAAGASYSYTPRRCSATNRCAAVLTGVVYTGDSSSADYYEPTEILLPLETAVPNDDAGVAWAGSTGYLTRVTSSPTPAQGTYCWKLTKTETTNTNRTIMRTSFSLPAGRDVIVRAKMYRSSGIAAYMEVLGTRANLAGASATWETVTVSSSATKNTRDVDIEFVIGPSTSSFSLGMDAIQILYGTLIVPVISTRLYVDARYAPGVSVPTYFALDTQQGQLVDTGSYLYWGDDRMLEFTYNTSCALIANVLKLNRFLKLSVRLEPVSEVVSAPSLPTVSVPVYPY